MINCNINILKSYYKYYIGRFFIMDEERKNNLITAVLLLVISIFFIFIFIEMTKENQMDIKQSFTEKVIDEKRFVDDSDKLNKRERLEQKEKIIYVHICGAVQNPGVYKISEGIITADVVNLAGGLLSTADMSAVNLARRVRNGEKIEIPTVFDKDRKNNFAENKRISYKNLSKKENIDDIEEIALVSDVININDASKGDIESIPGIGKKTAEKIISYRDEHGIIESLEELENIPGIRKNIISKCRKYLIVD